MPLTPDSATARDEDRSLIRLIAAMDSQRGIANEQGIPWHLPGDVAFFRAQTKGGVIVMGRTTYEEFDSPLPDRVNLVLTSKTGDLRDGFRSIGQLSEATTLYPGRDIWVIGGAGVYAGALPVADELVITKIFADFKCTKFFPPYEDAFAMSHAGDEQREGDIAYRFETWRRQEGQRAG